MASESGKQNIRVMKFGGTSVGNAERMLGVVALVAQALNTDRVCLVASAMAGVTNLLVTAADPQKGQDPAQAAADFLAIHEKALAELRPELGDAAEELQQTLKTLSEECQRLCQGVILLDECSPSVLANISSLGERASCAILLALLKARGLEPQYLDPRQYLIVEGDPFQARPRIEEIHARFAAWGGGTGRLSLLPVR